MSGAGSQRSRPRCVHTLPCHPRPPILGAQVSPQERPWPPQIFPFPAQRRGGCEKPTRPSEEHPAPPAAKRRRKQRTRARSPRRGPSPRAGGRRDLQVRSFPPVKTASAAREPQHSDSQGFAMWGWVFPPSLLVFLASTHEPGWDTRPDWR